MIHSFCYYWAKYLNSGAALAGEKLQDYQSRHSVLLGTEYSISCLVLLMFFFLGFGYVFCFLYFFHHCSNTHKVFSLFLFEFSHVAIFCDMKSHMTCFQIVVRGAWAIKVDNNLFSQHPLHKWDFEAFDTQKHLGHIGVEIGIWNILQGP